MNKMKKAIKQGTCHANPRWRRLAFLALKRMARKLQTFTSSDLLQRLQDSKIKTHDLRAVGGVMLQARDAGLIEPIRLVRRNDKHTRGATTLWRSLQFQPEACK